MMMSLGMFIFSLPTIVYQDLSHKRDVQHSFTPRIGHSDAVQFIGPGTETITLTGVTAYGINHASASYAALNRMMQTGEAWPLVDGLGNMFGQYIIRSIDLKKNNFQKFGQARNSGFTIELTRADDPGASIGNPALDRARQIIGNGAALLSNKLSIASLTGKVASLKLPGIKF